MADKVKFLWTASALVLCIASGVVFGLREDWGLTLGFYVASSYFALRAGWHLAAWAE